MYSRNLTILAALAIALLAGSGRLRAADDAQAAPLSQASQKLAQGIARYLVALDESSVLYGDFSGMSPSLCSQIRTEVMAELKKQGITEAKKRGMKLTCRLAAERENGRIVILLEADVLSRRKRVVHRYRETAVCKPSDLELAAPAR